MLVDVQISGSPVVVDGLDDDFVLQLIGESEEQAREADRRKLRLAVHWAERHVVSDALDAAYWSDDDPRDFAHGDCPSRLRAYTMRQLA